MARTALGISLALAGLGGGVCLHQILAAHPATSPAIVGSPEWQQITRVWDEGCRIDRSPEFSYPFTDEERDRLFRDIKTAGENADALRKAKLIEPAEADLLKVELQSLQTRLQRFRTKSLEMATCYVSMPIAAPAAVSTSRLAVRVGLLEMLAESNALHPAVLAVALSTAREDLRICSDEAELEKLTPEQREEARKVRDVVKVHLQKIQKRLEQGGLQTTREWKTIEATWEFVTPFAESGKSTEAQRKRITTRLDESKRAVNALADQGMLSPAEAQLLQSELERLSQQVYRDPPTDTMVTCYDRMMIWPAQESLMRLRARSAILAQAAQQGRLSPEAMAKVLPSIEADLKMLASPEELGQLPQAAQESAKQVAASVQREVEAIKARLVR